MKRREFIAGAAAAAAGLQLSTAACAQSAPSAAPSPRGSFALDANRVRFFTPAIREPFRITMIADTHLFTDDQRGQPYRQFSGRMAKAYNQTTHFETGEPTNPEESFVKALAVAKQSDAQLVALIGDLVSFPSEAAVEWVQRHLDAAGLPYVYTAGNHDWHYEGMAGPLSDLRATWIEKRLSPFYQGENPLMAARDINGVRFVTIDDSTYEILPEQLAFFREQVATNKPLVLMVHIPLYAPGRSVGYGCGHPQWGAETDRNWELERRPRWPESGHTDTTMAFHREVFSAPNLLGVLAGHIHRPTLDVINGIPQVVANANATGAYLDVEFVPIEG